MDNTQNPAERMGAQQAITGDKEYWKRAATLLARSLVAQAAYHLDLARSSVLCRGMCYEHLRQVQLLLGPDGPPELANRHTHTTRVNVWDEANSVLAIYTNGDEASS